MNHTFFNPNRLSAVLMIGVLLLPQLSFSQNASGPDTAAVPEAYRDRKMPEGWWTDPSVISEGKRIYEGKFKPKVLCAPCHGKFGKPKLRGARDFSDGSVISRFTDDYWFWRVSEGVPDTPMKGWTGALSEEEIWKVIAYSHTFSHGGKPAPHDH
ncbi:MAG TPA: cytochrome c [Nitrospiria bacterium]|nr:cytochrome c [Nitrospiria bacterium]